MVTSPFQSPKVSLTIFLSWPFPGLGRTKRFPPFHHVYLFVVLLLGVLAPKSKKEVAVSFRTDEAKVIIATIVVKVQEGASELTRVLKMSAIGKYPFITLD